MPTKGLILILLFAAVADWDTHSLTGRHKRRAADAVMRRWWCKFLCFVPPAWLENVISGIPLAQWRVGKSKYIYCDAEMRVPKFIGTPWNSRYVSSQRVINDGNYPRAPTTHFTIATKNICALAIKCVFLYATSNKYLCAMVYIALAVNFPLTKRLFASPDAPLWNNYYH